MHSILGPKKAAILLLAMGEESASQIIRNLGEADVQQIGYYMSRMTEVEPADLDSVLEEFYRKLAFQDQALGLNPGENFVHNALAKAFGDEKAKEMVENMADTGQKGALESLKWLDPKSIVQFISNEHPQTIALILAHLENPEQTGLVLKALPENIQSDVAYRMAVLESIPPGVLTEIDEVLTREMHNAGTFSASKVGGIEAVAETLNTLEKKIETRILTNIEDINPELAENIRELMFTFEDLALIDETGIQMLLGQVQKNDILLSLKTASENVKNILFNNMSKRQKEIMKDDLENMGPARITDIEAAQQKLVKVCRRLEEEGKIIISGRGGLEVY